MEEQEVITQDTHWPVLTLNNDFLINNNKILLQNKRSGDLMYVDINENIAKMFNIAQTEEGEEEPTEANETDVDDNAIEKKLWTRKAVLYLISKIKEASDQLDNEIKKNLWIKIAADCTQKFGKMFTPTQIDSKWKGLKRTYKNILLHNQTSGKSRRKWEFFNVIHDFMYKKPEITPEATCSNLNGMMSNIEDADVDTSSAEPDKANEFKSSFIRKRKSRETEATKRHNEKMARLDTFNNLFKQMIEKM